MKKIISILILIVCGVGLFFVAGLTDSKKSNKFLGSVRGAGDNTLLIFGAFDNETKLAKPQYEYQIVVDENTKITKNSFVLPSNGEMFVVEDLPKEIKDVGFETLRKDSQNVAIGIEVTLTRNFLGIVQNKAQEIVYIGPKY